MRRLVLVRSIGVLVVTLASLGPMATARAQVAEASVRELPPVPPAPVDEDRPSALLADTPGRPVLSSLVAVGAWAGLLFTAGMGVTAAAFACGDGLFSRDDDCFDPVFYSLLGIGGAIGLVAVPVSVWGVGLGLDGAGDLGWTLIGHVAGSLAWVFLPIAIALGVEGPALGGIAAFAGVAQVTATIVAFELSSAGSERLRE